MRACVCEPKVNTTQRNLSCLLKKNDPKVEQTLTTVTGNIILSLSMQFYLFHLIDFLEGGGERGREREGVR